MIKTIIIIPLRTGLAAPATTKAGVRKLKLAHINAAANMQFTATLKALLIVAFCCSLLSISCSLDDLYITPKEKIKPYTAAIFVEPAAVIAALANALSRAITIIMNFLGWLFVSGVGELIFAPSHTAAFTANILSPINNSTNKAGITGTRIGANAAAADMAPARNVSMVQYVAAINIAVIIDVTSLPVRLRSLILSVIVVSSVYFVFSEVLIKA